MTKRAPTRSPYSGHELKLSVALWKPTNPLPPATKAGSANRSGWLAGRSPHVKKTTASYGARAAASSPVGSVRRSTVNVPPLAWAIAVIAARAFTRDG